MWHFVEVNSLPALAHFPKYIHSTQMLSEVVMERWCVGHMCHMVDRGEGEGGKRTQIKNKNIDYKIAAVYVNINPQICEYTFSTGAWEYFP